MACNLFQNCWLVFGGKYQVERTECIYDLWALMSARVLQNQKRQQQHNNNNNHNNGNSNSSNILVVCNFIFCVSIKKLNAFLSYFARFNYSPYLYLYLYMVHHHHVSRIECCCISTVVHPSFVWLLKCCWLWIWWDVIAMCGGKIPLMMLVDWLVVWDLLNSLELQLLRYLSMDTKFNWSQAAAPAAAVTNRKEKKRKVKLK